MTSYHKTKHNKHRKIIPNGIIQNVIFYDLKINRKHQNKHEYELIQFELGDRLLNKPINGE